MGCVRSRADRRWYYDRPLTVRDDAPATYHMQVMIETRHDAGQDLPLVPLRKTLAGVWSHCPFRLHIVLFCSSRTES